jgi:hypothetical protein
VSPLTPAVRSSAWAGLLAEQRVEPPPTAPPVRPSLARAGSDCRTARAGIASSFAAADRARPAPAWVREWVSCLDELLALAEKIHAHVEARPPARFPTPI